MGTVVPRFGRQSLGIYKYIKFSSLQPKSSVSGPTLPLVHKKACPRCSRRLRLGNTESESQIPAAAWFSRGSPENTPSTQWVQPLLLSLLWLSICRGHPCEWLSLSCPTCSSPAWPVPSLDSHHGHHEVSAWPGPGTQGELCE